jgi:hypothetical protein
VAALRIPVSKHARLLRSQAGPAELPDVEGIDETRPSSPPFPFSECCDRARQQAISTREHPDDAQALGPLAPAANQRYLAVVDTFVETSFRTGLETDPEAEGDASHQLNGLL